MIEFVKLSEWARAKGVNGQSFTGWFHARMLAVPAGQLAAGMIMVEKAGLSPAGVAIYAGVSSGDQGAVLDGQVARLMAVAAGRGLASTRVVAEVGSGFNGGRAKLVWLLRHCGIGVNVVEHRDRVAGFGVEYLEAAVAARGGRLVVVKEAEVVLTTFGAHLHRRRTARRRAEAALVGAQSQAAA
ncbi:MAG: recombinase family protein [Acidimicrobiales bacterium]